MELNRRDFLKGTASVAALAAGTALVGCTAAADDSGTTDTTTTTTTSKWSFEVAPDPIPEADIASTESADVIVVGAGVSGLVSALSSLENGLSVILVSASDAGVCRGGSNNAVYSRLMEAAGIERVDGDWFYRKEFLANGGNVNMALWYKHYRNSEEAMNWIIDVAETNGVKCAVETSAPYPKGDPMYQAPCSHGFYKTDEETLGQIGYLQAYLVEALINEINASGGTIHFGTKAEQLVRDNGGTGRVSAVVCSAKDGTYQKFEAVKAVVLATGDFSHDLEMLERYCPQAVSRTNPDAAVDYNLGFGIGGLMPGDGQKMGLWVGAGWQEAPNCLMVGSPFPGSHPYSAHTGLMVNSTGERFMNEDCTGGVASISLLHQPDGTGYCIWGANYAEASAPWVKANHPYGTPPNTPDEVLATWAAGTTADTVEGIIEALGLPASTIDAVNRYNELCAKGTDEDFCKNASKMIPIAEPPFFGGSFSPAVLTVLGGLRTTNDLQVCQADKTPIEGLYNVGSMIGDMFSGTYTFQMEGINYGACCITLPYLLGKHLSAL